MRKKIAVFSTAWNGEHVGGILKGICDKLKETKDDLYIFNTYGGFEAEKEYNDCEYSIFDLPLESDIDGVIIVSSSIDTPDRLAKIIKKCRENKIPCISAELELPEVHYIGADNYAAMSAVVEHLITVHGCRTFNYVGGPAGNSENCQRKKAFCDVLAKHDIPVDEARIRDYDFNREGGEQAFFDFYSKGLAFPDAVVCANDNMATGYINMVQSSGYRVPEDTIVTGFDNLFESRSYIPGITSVGRSREKLGEACVEAIMKMIAGETYPQTVFVPFELSLNESCGCNLSMEEQRKVRKRFSDKVYRDKQIRWRMNLMQKKLVACQTEEEMKNALHEEMQNLDIRSLSLLINEDEQILLNQCENGQAKSESGYAKRMRLFFDGQGAFREDTSETIETRKLIPKRFREDGKESHVLIFLPLHLKGKLFGYCIIEDNINFIKDENLFYLISMINVAMDNIRQNTYIRILNKKLSHMYMHDAMTGIYNRFALKSFGEPLLERNQIEGRRTLLMFADMDGLKHINDTYGHDVGDLSIKVMANVMQQSCPDSSYFCIRYGGDEFLMMGTCDSEDTARFIKSSIEKRIEETALISELPVKLSASIGYILTSRSGPDNSLDEYISQADKIMYQIKKERKHGGKKNEADQSAFSAGVQEV